MEQNTYKNLLSGQETLQLLQNLQACCHVQRACFLTVVRLIQSPLTSCFHNVHLNSIVSSMHRSSFRFSDQICVLIFVCCMCAACVTHLILDLIDLIIVTEDYKLQFCPSYSCFLSLRYRCSHQHFVLCRLVSVFPLGCKMTVMNQEGRKGRYYRANFKSQYFLPYAVTGC